MLKQHAKLISGTLRLVDTAMLGLAFPVAYYLRDQVLGAGHVRPDRLYPIGMYLPLLAVSLLVWQFASWSTGIYQAYRTRSVGNEIVRLARAFAILAVVTAAGEFVLKQSELFSRLLFGLYFAIAFAMLVANRATARVALRAARRRGYNTRTFAVVGCGGMGDEVVRAIRGHREWGYVFAGYVLEEHDTPPASGKVLGRLSDMGALLESHVLDEVIFGVPRERLDAIEEAVQLCEEQGVGVKVLLNFFPNRVAKLAIEELDGIPILAFTRTPTDLAPLVSKRVFDLVVSTLVLLLLSPLFVVIAVAIKLESPGPVLFRQRRVGRNGREFWLYKFRSMCDDAESKLAELRERNEVDGPAFKMRSDPRITRVGRFLRKTSLDECPQFWNVLKGEMSLVGPRPERPVFIEEFKRQIPRYHLRHMVKSGITGWAQVNGLRGDTSIRDRIDYDLYYIENWSLLFDLKILLRTALGGFLSRNAY